MDKLAIKSYNFDNAKNNLKKFSEGVSTTVNLETVKTEGGLFGLFDHKVTGQELNNLTGQIQEYLISINNQNMKTIKEFGQIYEALEALDKEYINAILISIKGAETASNQAKKAALNAEKNTIDISNTIKVQEQTIKILKKFKEQIDQYKSLENIDEIWSDHKLFKENLEVINSHIENISESLDIQMNTINTLVQFKKEIDNYENLKNIDEVWNDTQLIKEDIEKIYIKIENQEAIFDRLNKKQMDFISTLIDEEKRKNDDRNNILLKKIKTSYILLMGSISISVITFILYMLGSR